MPGSLSLLLFLEHNILDNVQSHALGLVSMYSCSVAQALESLLHICKEGEMSQSFFHYFSRQVLRAYLAQDGSRGSQSMLWTDAELQPEICWESLHVPMAVLGVAKTSEK